MCEEISICSKVVIKYQECNTLLKFIKYFPFSLKYVILHICTVYEPNIHTFEPFGYVSYFIAQIQELCFLKIRNCVI